MSTQGVVAIVIVVIVALLLIAVAAAAARHRRTKRLRSEFGPEYDRTVGGAGKRRDAEKDLLARKDEHAQLELRELTPAARERYLTNWTQVQSKFVDSPVIAVNEADELVTQVLAERGYPTEDFDTQARLLSVEHAHVLENYRAAHQVELNSRAQQANTEQIRNALLDFRSVFEEVIADVNPTGRTSQDTSLEPTAAQPQEQKREIGSRHLL